ncbi:hypothetical protein BA6E_105128 [Bacteroidales bacterium 6E]|nr:hypothetical protein BA6E_105128 [Bacteroidales bacterium 6E]
MKRHTERKLKNSCVQKKISYLCYSNFMKIYNSNISNALIQDLGPFKLKSANLSRKGKTVLEYKTLSQPQIIGSQNVYGNNITHGYLLSTSIKEN